MKISLYNSLLTKKRTIVVGSIGKCGYPGYREVHVCRALGTFSFQITDGYKVLMVKHGFKQGLKSVLNIAEGYMVESVKATA